MNLHFSEVCRFSNHGTTADTFDVYFGTQARRNPIFSLLKNSTSHSHPMSLTSIGNNNDDMLGMVEDLSLSTKLKSSNGSGGGDVELENVSSRTRNRMSSTAPTVEIPIVWTKNICDIVEIKILRELNPILVSKTFDTQTAPFA